MTAPEVVSALRPVVAWMDAHGVPHRIGGSLASSVHGVARSTLDVDLVVELPESLAPLLAAELSGDYYVDEDSIREAVRRRASFNLVHLATMVKVDVFIPKAADYDLVAFGRFRREPLDATRPEESFLIVTPEDIVLRKLLWYEAGGRVSERQWNDVRGVLSVQGEALDREYLDLWAGRLGLTELLAQVRAEAAE
jgi:hypothetical protein